MRSCGAVSAAPPAPADRGFRRATRVIQTKAADSQPKHLPHHSLGVPWVPGFLQPGAGPLELELAWGRGGDRKTSPAALKDLLLFHTSKANRGSALLFLHWTSGGDTPEDS